MPQYRLRSSARAEQLEKDAAAESERAKRANQRADNNMLAVVLCASALFFAGISSKLQTTAARATILGLGFVVFLAAVAWIATIPVQLTT